MGAIKKAFKAIGKAVEKAVDSVGQIAKGLVTLDLKGAAKGIKNLANAGAEITRNLINLTPAAMAANKLLDGALDKVLKKVQSAATAVANQMVDSVAGGLENIKNGVVKTAKGIAKGDFKAILSGIKDVAVGTIETASNFGPGGVAKNLARMAVDTAVDMATEKAAGAVAKAVDPNGTSAIGGLAADALGAAAGAAASSNRGERVATTRGPDGRPATPDVPGATTRTEGGFKDDMKLAGENAGRAAADTVLQQYGSMLLPDFVPVPSIGQRESRGTRDADANRNDATTRSEASSDTRRTSETQSQPPQTPAERRAERKARVMEKVDQAVQMATDYAVQQVSNIVAERFAALPQAARFRDTARDVGSTASAVNEAASMFQGGGRDRSSSSDSRRGGDTSASVNVSARAANDPKTDRADDRTDGKSTTTTTTTTVSTTTSTTTTSGEFNTDSKNDARGTRGTQGTESVDRSRDRREQAQVVAQDGLAAALLLAAMKAADIFLPEFTAPDLSAFSVISRRKTGAPSQKDAQGINDKLTVAFEDVMRGALEKGSTELGNKLAKPGANARKDIDAAISDAVATVMPKFAEALTDAVLDARDARFDRQAPPRAGIEPTVQTAYDMRLRA